MLVRAKRMGYHLPPTSTIRVIWYSSISFTKAFKKIFIPRIHIVNSPFAKGIVNSQQNYPPPFTPFPQIVTLTEVFPLYIRGRIHKNLTPLHSLYSTPMNALLVIFSGFPSIRVIGVFPCQSCSSQCFVLNRSQGQFSTLISLFIGFFL